MLMLWNRLIKFKIINLNNKYEIKMKFGTYYQIIYIQIKQQQFKMSESSQDYQAIVGHFLDSRRQWQSLPQVVYLTIKAMFQHCQSLQQSVLCHKQLITEQSIRLRELDIELRAYVEKNFNIDQIQEIPFQAQTGFRKNKKPSNKQFSSIKRQFRSQSNKKGRLNQNQSNLKSSCRSFSQDKVIDQMAIQQIKNLAQMMISQKISERNKDLIQNFNIFKQQTNLKIQQAELIIKKQISKVQQNLNGNLNQKVRQAQKQLANKSQIERANIVKFVEENAMQTQKIWAQLSQMHIRVDKFIQQNKLCYSNPVYLKADSQNDTQRKTKKAGQKRNSNQKNSQDNKEYEKPLEFYSNLNLEFKQFKLKIMKDCAGFIKGQQIQSILAKFQKQISNRISSLSSTISLLQKEFQSARRQTLMKSQSKNSIPYFKTLQQDQKSRSKKGKLQESLRQIQESLQKLQNYFKQKLKSHKKQLISQMEKKFQQQQLTIRDQLNQQMQFRQKSMCDIVQTNCDKVMRHYDRGSSQDTVQLRKAVQKLSQQMILARFLHFGERQCRQFIQWQKNIYTSMQENFVWKAGSPTVQVIASGLYRVQAGLYPDNQAEIIQGYLVLNGQPISSLKHKQVPANSKAMARGSIFNQAILIPAKSKITIKVELPFFGQAYLQIHKL